MNTDSALAHRGGDALHVAGTDIANREDPRQTGFEHLRRTGQGPSRPASISPYVIQVAAGEDETLLIHRDTSAQPLGLGRGPRHQEHVMDRMRRRLTGLSIPPRDAFQMP